MKKKIQYRKRNFRASESREGQNVALHPHLIDGLIKIAKDERKSVSWLVETALSDYFGVEVLLKKCRKVRPARNMRDNILYKRRA